MKLNSSERTLPVSVSNIKAWIETGLRQFRAIDDSENVANITLGPETDGQGLKSNKWQDEKVVLVTIKFKREEVHKYTV